MKSVTVRGKRVAYRGNGRSITILVTEQNARSSLKAIDRGYKSYLGL